jgi:hypothetical protein
MTAASGSVLEGPIVQYVSGMLRAGKCSIRCVEIRVR